MRVGGLGAPELILIALALILVFGAGKVGDLGGALGKSVRDFKKAMHDDEAPAEEPQAEAPAAMTIAAPNEQSAPLPVPEYRPALAAVEPKPTNGPSRPAGEGPPGAMPAA